MTLPTYYYGAPTNGASTPLVGVNTSLLGQDTDLQRQAASINLNPVADSVPATTAPNVATSWFPDWMKSINQQMGDGIMTLANNNSTSMANVVGPDGKIDVTGAVAGGTADKLTSSVKQFFTDSAVTIAVLVVGVLLLLGAFLTYRK